MMNDPKTKAQFEAISKVVNDYNFDINEVARMMASDHRYLQTQYYKLFKAFINEMSVKDRCNVDQRNVDAVRGAKTINEMWVQGVLEF